VTVELWGEFAFHWIYASCSMSGSRGVSDKPQGQDWEKMSWIKLGLIFESPQDLSWMCSHSAVPCALHLHADVYRVYFTGRDLLNRAHVGWFEMDLQNPRSTLAVSRDAVLAPGPLGSFDEHGAMTSWLVPDRERLLLYYTGWARGHSVPFVNSIGLAVSTDGGLTFSKISEGPILCRSRVDPYFVANPCVLKEADGWKMWYLSCVRWQLEEGKPKHYYHLRFARSSDGIDWQREGKVCIDFASPSEYAISRPCVLKENGIYRMWYSYRGDRYRIGYAESLDGTRWRRLDHEAGIDVSTLGWDAEMVEYAFVFRHRTRYYMLYNGNDYGRTGIGLAVKDIGKGAVMFPPDARIAMENQGDNGPPRSV